MDVTREELYEKVWRKPMTRLAEEYGVSNFDLAKLCRALDVPTPPVGHWMKLQHGKQSPQPPLPPPRPEVAREPRIRRSPASRTKPAVDLVAAERVQKDVRRESGVAVAQRLTNPHPAVRATADALAGATPDDYGMVQPRFHADAVREAAPLAVRVSPALKGRALRLADALLKALAEKGHRLEPGKRADPRYVGRGTAPAVMIGDEAVPFVIEERSNRSDHVPTAAELARSKQYSYRSYPKWSYAPSGKLGLRIDTVVR